jgi:hypothetical protein
MFLLSYNIFILSFYFHFINICLSNASIITIQNKCNYTLPIFSHENRNFIQKCNLNNNEKCSLSYDFLESGLIKTTLSEQATLFEFTINSKGIWYDISIIPPGSGICYNYDECFEISKKIGYNIPIQIKVSKTSDSCKNLECLSNRCEDAYLYPYDDLKTHYCTLDNNFDIIYCPINNQQDNPFLDCE